jgi:hypothetical protein
VEEIAWQFHPEFVVRVLIDGQEAGEAVTVAPSPVNEAERRNQGLLTRPVAGGVLGCVRRRPHGNDWVPAVELDEPRVFTFWLMVRQGSGAPPLEFFESGSSVFGRQILYANNLTAGGAIDDNLTGGVVNLAAGPQAGDAERGALGADLLSVGVDPGEFTQIRAGEIRAGGAVVFAVSMPISPEDASAALDFRPLRKGSYLVRLEGVGAIEERVVIDERTAAAQVNGVIDIFRDTWHTPAEPREYRIDFAST